MKKKMNIYELKRLIKKVSDHIGLKNLRGEIYPKHGVLLIWGWNVPRFFISPKGEKCAVAYSTFELLEAVEKTGLGKLLGKSDVGFFGKDGWFDISYPRVTHVGCKPAVVFDLEKLEKFLQWTELNREFGQK